MAKGTTPNQPRLSNKSTCRPAGKRERIHSGLTAQCRNRSRLHRWRITGREVGCSLIERRCRGVGVLAGESPEPPELGAYFITHQLRRAETTQTQKIIKEKGSVPRMIAFFEPPIRPFNPSHGRSTEMRFLKLRQYAGLTPLLSPKTTTKIRPQTQKFGQVLGQHGVPTLRHGVPTLRHGVPTLRHGVPTLRHGALTLPPGTRKSPIDGETREITMTRANEPTNS